MIDSLKYGFTREYNRFETIQMDEIAKSRSLQLHAFTVLIKRINSRDTTDIELHNYNKCYGY